MSDETPEPATLRTFCLGPNGEPMSWNSNGEFRVTGGVSSEVVRYRPPRPTHSYAVLTPSEDTNWGWEPQHAEFFVDREQAIKWGQRERGVVVALPIIADYRETAP